MELKLNIAKNGITTNESVINEEFTLHYGHIFRGLSAYEYAVNGGFEGTKEEYEAYVGNIGNLSEEAREAATDARIWARNAQNSADNADYANDLAREGAESANVAATNANKAAGRVETAITSATTAASSANAAAEEATKATNKANEAAGKVTEFEENLNNKADKEGYYPSMSVGMADNLVGRGDMQEAYINFRSSAGIDTNITDGAARIKKIKGNSVAWNQQFPNFEDVQSNYQIDCSVQNNALHFTGKIEGEYGNKTITSLANVIANRVYFIQVFFDNESKEMHWFNGGYNEANGGVYKLTSGTPLVYTSQITRNGNILWPFSINNQETVYPTATVYKWRFIDLTQMFGVGNEPTTIEEFNERKPMNIDEFAYNEGELIDMKVDKLVSTGDNLLNINLPIVQAPVGYTPTTPMDFVSFDKAYSGIAYNGYTYSRGDLLTQKIEGGVTVQGNLGGYGLGIFFKAIPKARYIADWQGDATICVGFLDATKKVFHSETWVRDTRNIITAPAAAEYGVIVIRSAYKEEDVTATNIGLYLVHSGYKVDNIKYIPYEQDVKDVSWVNEIKNDGELLFPYGMRSAGDAHDEVRYNRTTNKWEAVKRIGEVDLGLQNWGIAYSYNSGVYNWRFNLQGSSATSNSKVGNIVTNNMVVDSADNVYLRKQVRSIALVYNSNGNYVQVSHELTAEGDKTSFIKSMQGQILYYELAEPIVVEIPNSENFNLDYLVWDFGTEEAIAIVPSAPFRADINYEFNAVDNIRWANKKIAELEAKISQLLSVQSTNIIND